MEVEIPVPAQPAVPLIVKFFPASEFYKFSEKTQTFCIPFIVKFFSCVGVLQIFRKNSDFLYPLSDND